MPQVYSWPTALYLPYLPRRLALFIIRGCIPYSAYSHPIFCDTVRSLSVPCNIRRCFQDESTVTVILRFKRIRTLSEGNVTRYQTGHAMGVDDDALHVRYQRRAVKAL